MNPEQVVPRETPGIQELYTRDHGTVKVKEISFQDGGYHIVKCPNGAYMHANGLPIKDENELRAAIPAEFLDDALDWFQNRHETSENPIRPIGFNREGTPIFADGSVPEFSDLYAFFQPGPILTAAIVALQNYQDRLRGNEPAPAPKPKAKAQTKKSTKKSAKSAKKATATALAPEQAATA